MFRTKYSFSSRAHYATKLKKRLDFAYKAAARESNKSGQRNKSNYDLKVRNSVLDMGARVLIRKVGYMVNTNWLTRGTGIRMLSLVCLT